MVQNDWWPIVIKYCVSVLHPLLYNLFEIFWKISKIWCFRYFDIFENIMIFSNPAWGLTFECWYKKQYSFPMAHMVIHCGRYCLFVWPNGRCGLWPMVCGRDMVHRHQYFGLRLHCLAGCWAMAVADLVTYSQIGRLRKKWIFWMEIVSTDPSYSGYHVDLWYYYQLCWLSIREYLQGRPSWWFPYTIR